MEERGRRRGNDVTRIDDGVGMEKVLGLVWVLGKLEKKKKEEGRRKELKVAEAKQDSGKG